MNINKENLQSIGFAFISYGGDKPNQDDHYTLRAFSHHDSNQPTVIIEMKEKLDNNWMIKASVAGIEPNSMVISDMNQIIPFISEAMIYYTKDYFRKQTFELIKGI